MITKQLKKCEHQFVFIRTITRPAPRDNNSTVEFRYEDLYGVVVGCHLCGKIKKIWENGIIEQ